jgi:hypothetical protein
MEAAEHTRMMKLGCILLLLAGCNFQVPGLALGAGSPDLGTAPIAPAPSTPPIGTTGTPPSNPPAPTVDMASAPAPTSSPDLAPAADLTPPGTVQCASNQDCRVSVDPGQNETIVCADRSTCDVDCLVGATCIVECGRMARCTCTGDGCQLTGCKPMKCQGGELVCGQQCQD